MSRAYRANAILLDSKQIGILKYKILKAVIFEVYNLKNIRHTFIGRIKPERGEEG